MRKKNWGGLVACFLVVQYFVILLGFPEAGAAVFTVDDTVTDGAPGSLRDAVQQANAAAGEDTIVLQPGKYMLNLGQLEIQQDLSLEGGGANKTTINGDGNDRVLMVTNAINPNIKVNIKGVTITGGQAPEIEYQGACGGGIYNSGRLIIRESRIVENIAALKSHALGGGIYNEGELTIIKSAISKNKTSDAELQWGAGIYSKGNLTIRRSIINENATMQGHYIHGGGICSNGQIKITGSIISANEAKAFGTADGGGILNWSSDAELIIKDCHISHNTAEAIEVVFGGGIASSGPLTVERSHIVGNTVTGGIEYAGGGGISAGNDMTISFSKVTNNSINGEWEASGGGIRSSSNLTVFFCQINGNTANGYYWAYGGGIYNSAIDAATLRLIGSQVIKNTAKFLIEDEESNQEGGGIWIRSKVEYSPKYSVIRYNFPDQVFTKPPQQP